MIVVSRESISKKLFNITEEQVRAELSGEELESTLALLPTENERDWMRIFRSTAPEVARLQRKMSVCVDAEVIEYDDNHVKYNYSDEEFEIKSPTNSFNILRELENGIPLALRELSNQGCIKKAGIDVILEKEPVDSLSLIMKIANKFFFRTYLE